MFQLLIVSFETGDASVPYYDVYAKMPHKLDPALVKAKIEQYCRDYCDDDLDYDNTVYAALKGDNVTPFDPINVIENVIVVHIA